MKKLILITFAALFATNGATETNEDMVIRLMEFVSAQGHCSSYANYTYDNYGLAGFSSKDAAKKAAKEHLDLALSGAEEMLAFALNKELDGKFFFKQESQSYCFLEICVDKREYFAGMFAFGGIDDGAEQITEKVIACPSDDIRIHKCTGNEPVENWGSKAAKLYKDKNCSLLRR